MPDMSAIQRAAFLLGGQSALARAIGNTPDLQVTPQAVQAWCRSGRVPAERVLAVERATNGRVTRFELRPDLYVTAA